MAMGFSGSNAGIGEIYKKVLYVDVEAGIRKYQELLPEVSENVKPLYETTIKNLELLLSQMQEFGVRK
ncbi:hypothetical protein KAT36_01240 [Candidatus Pacearchaeota archaeon]|nr:hypothetical protein [Candidatus Pacearchaeota archaeon]